MYFKIFTWCCLFVGVLLDPTPTCAQDAHEQWAARMHQLNPQIEASFKIDEAAVQAAGIQKISSVHLDLYTDVRDPEKLDGLTDAFDLAVKQWCRAFDFDYQQVKPWKLRAFLMADINDTSRFQQAGLLPADLPKFLAGYQRGPDLWFYLQPGDYYTRHLMIHEGTHAFMLWFLGGYGAPWYGEGMAELFGVHRWQNKQLKMRYRLRDRSEAEYWGRVKRIKDEHAAGEGMTLEQVLQIPPTAFIEVRYYAWSWAGCEFFGKHAKSSDAFNQLLNFTDSSSSAFNQQFRRSIQTDWDVLARDWELFVDEMEYGYQIARGRLSEARLVEGNHELEAGKPAKFSIAANRSWQTTQIEVKRGDRFLVNGTGEFIVAHADDSATPWKSQSNGITIEYHRGFPLGMLHAGILDPQAGTPREQVKGLVKPLPVGLTAEITAAHDGWLCLRINESPATLDDNQGGLEVTIEKLE